MPFLDCQVSHLDSGSLPSWDRLQLGASLCTLHTSGYGGSYGICTYFYSIACRSPLMVGTLVVGDSLMQMLHRERQHY